jgi:hypothetical protein
VHRVFEAAQWKDVQKKLTAWYNDALALLVDLKAARQ